MSGMKKYILFLGVIIFIPSGFARATLTFDSQTSECLSCHKEIYVDESRFCAQLDCDHPFAPLRIRQAHHGSFAHLRQSVDDALHLGLGDAIAEATTAHAPAFEPPLAQPPAHGLGVHAQARRYLLHGQQAVFARRSGGELRL